MDILKMIIEGKYRRYQEAGEWNRMGSYMMQGAYVYDFGNDVALHTFDHAHWWLYVNNDIVSYKDAPDNITDATINAAFDAAKLTKIKTLIK